MSTPRIEINLHKIYHNTQQLVRHLEFRGISVTGVTKAVCGNPAIANAMLKGGATSLADARVNNVQRLRAAGIACPISMIRTPLLSQLAEVVLDCDTSYNTEISVIMGLGAAALRAGIIHNVFLMIEMGDMREGVLPEHVKALAFDVGKIQGIALQGIGVNFTCFSSQVPEAESFTELSILATEIEQQCGAALITVSGGNSASLDWALGEEPTGRVNDLRLGEAILLGVDPASGDRICGLYTDAFTLFAEVIETKAKPTSLETANASTLRSILALGQQDTDVAGLTMPLGVTFVGATSDHTVVTTEQLSLLVGSEVKLQFNYSSLMRAMASNYIEKVLVH